MSLARLSVRNPVPANLLMIAVVILGLLAFASLPRELMSDVSFNWVFIITAYPGVPAEEIEKLITIPIEEELRDIKGIDSVASQSAEGSSFISVKFSTMSDEEFRARLQDVRFEVDKVEDLPEEALETQIQAFGSADFAPLVSVHLYGAPVDREMIAIARQLREELLAVPRLAKIELTGIRKREIWVEADPGRLQGYALSLAELQNAIGAAGRNVPAGKISVGRHELLVRTVAEFGDTRDIGEVIVRATPGGTAVRVHDVASVTDTFEKDRTKSWLDGEPVVSLLVSKRNDGNTIAIIDEVKRVTERFAARHPGRFRVGYTQDSSEAIVDILSKLSANAWLGFVVVLVVLFAVLGTRNAVLAALGIPLSFLACFVFMDHTGESLNGNSLFALVLVLGIIVDDAIIVVENCYRHLQAGKTWHQAAIDGTDEVIRPIFSATATTIAAFLPLVLLPGIIGKFMRIIPVTVSLALLASLIEAFIILPSHFAGWPGRSRQAARKDPIWMRNLRAGYLRALRLVLRRRRTFVAGMILSIPAAGLLVAVVGTNMFAGEEVNTFQVRITMPTGTNLETTAATLREFEAAAATLPKSEVRAVHSTAGLLVTDDDWVFRSNVGQLWMDVSMSYDRERSVDDIMAELRGRLQSIAGPVTIELAKMNTGPPVGKPVEIKLKGKYFDQLQQLASELEAKLAATDGVFDIGNDLRAGSKELQIRVDPDKAAAYGLTAVQVGMSVRAAVEGVESARMYDGDEEIDIVVRVSERFLQHPEDLARLPLSVGTDRAARLGDVATFSTQATFANLRRYKNQRAVTVFANIDETRTSSVEVNQALGAQFEALAPRFPGVTLDFSGEFQEFKEAFSSLAQLFLFGVLLIYAILGAQFRSYVQPVIVLFTVPFAFVGASVGLVVSGNPFSITTLFGMVALAGVAVNDAIVLISFANDARARGATPEEAILEAAPMRLRPIILTSVTTIAGLLPMAMGLGGMSLTWGPLANTIVWGLGVATLLTLFLIPALYVLLVRGESPTGARTAASEAVL